MKLISTSLETEGLIKGGVPPDKNKTYIPFLRQFARLKSEYRVRLMLRGIFPLRRLSIATLLDISQKKNKQTK